MKQFIIITGTILVLFLWLIPIIVYKLTNENGSFGLFILSAFVSIIWITYLDDKWDDV